MSHINNDTFYRLHNRENAETIAKLYALLPGTYYDGGTPTLVEMFERMSADAANWRYLQSQRATQGDIDTLRFDALESPRTEIIAWAEKWQDGYEADAVDEALRNLIRRYR